MSIRKWMLSPMDKDRASKISEEWGIPFFLGLMLDIRGIVEEKEITSFLSNEVVLEDPLILIDMDKAVKRIKESIDNFEKICVYGDYDADGITSTALVYSYLESCGADVVYYIPQRESEGYGLNNGAIEKLNNQGVKLIITVDNGIVSVDEVDYAKSLGIDTVITDHHQPRDILPRAEAVVDPHRLDCKSKFKNFAGVGVAFKLISALEGKDGDILTLFENYADLIAIGTVADIVSLKDENRFFVKEGLKHIKNADRIGIKAILDQAGVNPKKLTAGKISFTIAPRINAGGRLGTSDKAVKILISDSLEEADSIAVEINDENLYRKEIEIKILKEVEDLFEMEPWRKYDRILVIEGKDWHQGVVGIVASRITEKYGKPCIIISIDGDMAKGSGRSIEGFSLYEAICSCSEYLTRFGGHPMAAGINLESKYIEPFKIKINEYAKNWGDMPFPLLKVDCKLKPEAVSVDLVDQVLEMEPFGCGNPTPVFAICNLKLEEIHSVGAGKHLKLVFNRDNTNITAMKFSTQESEFPYIKGDILDIAVTLDASEYYGEKSLSIYIKDMKFSDCDIDDLLYQKNIYEAVKRGEEIEIEDLGQILPTRNEIATVYRYLKKSNGWNYGLDILCYRIKEDNICFEKLAIILDIMEELKLIEISTNEYVYKIKMNNVEGKVDLESSSILKVLKQMKGDVL